MDDKSIFYEVNDILLNRKQPSLSIRKLINDGKFNKEPFSKIKKLQGIDQNLKYHPEGNVLNHVLLVVDRASEVKGQSNNEQAFMWAALLHDIGKLTTTKIRNGRITSYNHDVEGEKISYDFVLDITKDEELSSYVSKLVRWHMQLLYFDKNLKFLDCSKMISEIDYNEVALLCLCDRLGRGNISEETILSEKEKVKRFIAYCEEQSK